PRAVWGRLRPTVLGPLAGLALSGPRGVVAARRGVGSDALLRVLVRRRSGHPRREWRAAAPRAVRGDPWLAERRRPGHPDIRHVGLPLAAPASPVIYLFGLAGLTLGTSLPAGVGAMAGTTLQDHAVSDPAQRILLTLFPERVRATVTALVEGAAKRVGAIAGN